MKNNNENSLTVALYNMLQIALIEIRASDDVVRSKQLADIFHNLPNKLAQINSEDEALQAYATLRKNQRNMVLNNI